MITLVSYASDNMTISQEKLVVSSLKYGVEKTLSYGPESIDSLFYSMNRETLSAERGAGYWLWKPYVINKVLNSGHLHDGDYLIYCDSGIEIINDVSLLTASMDEDILLFSNGWRHVEWCKADCMKAINHWEVYDRFYHPQVQASVILMKYSNKVTEFMKEWLLWCQMPGFIDDSPSRHMNCKTFAEHRHDQAILTCMQIKHGYKLHWWPALYADHIKHGYNDEYPVMFNHHRKRNHEW